MTAYLDTSALVAWFHAADELASQLHRWRQSVHPDIFLNPLLRHELRHNLRRIVDSQWRATAWNAYRSAESARLFLRARWDWNRIMDDADALGAEYGSTCSAGSWDWAHVAAARAANVDIFVTGDEAQVAGAKAAGLKVKSLASRSNNA